MRAAPLSVEEVSTLPRPRRLWVRHLVALAFLALVVLATTAGETLARSSHHGVFLSDVAQLSVRAAPGVLLLPVFRKVSFRRRDVLFFALIPLWGLVIAWKTGFRLPSLPYRDWPPRPEESPRRRRVPGSPYYVLAPLPGIGLTPEHTVAVGG